MTDDERAEFEAMWAELSTADRRTVSALVYAFTSGAVTVEEIPHHADGTVDPAATERLLTERGLLTPQTASDSGSGQ